MRLVRAYAVIKGSDAIEALSREKGCDAAARIEANLLREMVDFVLLVPWHYQMGNNLSGYFASIAEVGKVVGEPRYVHACYRYLDEVFYHYGREMSSDIGYQRNKLLIHGYSVER